MKPIKFKESNVVYAKDQPEYLPLPAYRNHCGDVISLWKLNFKERIKILFTGKLWLHVLTFNHPLQPLRPTLDYPFVKPKRIYNNMSKGGLNLWPQTSPSPKDDPKGQGVGND